MYRCRQTYVLSRIYHRRMDQANHILLMAVVVGELGVLLPPCYRTAALTCIPICPVISASIFFNEALEREARAFGSWFSEETKQTFSLRAKPRLLGCRMCRHRPISVHTRTNSNCDFTKKKANTLRTAFEFI